VVESWRGHFALFEIPHKLSVFTKYGLDEYCLICIPSRLIVVLQSKPRDCFGVECVDYRTEEAHYYLWVEGFKTLPKHMNLNVKVTGGVYTSPFLYCKLTLVWRP